MSSGVAYSSRVAPRWRWRIALTPAASVAACVIQASCRPARFAAASGDLGSSARKSRGDLHVGQVGGCCQTKGPRRRPAPAGEAKKLASGAQVPQPPEWVTVAGLDREDEVLGASGSPSCGKALRLLQRTEGGVDLVRAEVRAGIGEFPALGQAGGREIRPATARRPAGGAGTVDRPCRSCRVLPCLLGGAVWRPSPGGKYRVGLRPVSAAARLPDPAAN